MFGKFGGWEILLILVIVLIVFGVGKLPQVGNAIGKGIRAFRRGQSGEKSEEESEPEKDTTVSKSKKPTAKKSA